MADATLRYNPDRSLCELQIGTSEDDIWGPLDASEAGHVLVDEETGKAYYLALTDDEGLASDTLYELEPVTTDLEEGAEIEETEETEDGTD
jgi:hypothetical protein